MDEENLQRMEGAQSANMNTPSVDPRGILSTNPMIAEIKNLKGVMRIDYETYGQLGSPFQQPIFVVVCNSDFGDRSKIPDYVQNVRMIISYEEEVPPMEAEKIIEEEGGDEDDSSDSSGDMEEESESKI